MKQYILVLLAVACLMTAGIAPVYGWGIWGHNHINRGAVLALPKEMGMFFYNHSDFLTEESTVPDLRKYTLNDKWEFCRHYVNLERYGYKTRATVPRTLQAVTDRYGKDSIAQFGILPWYIQDMMGKLTIAFKNKKKTEILFIAGDLGHYIADAHMPLHTTVNHDGEATGQQGIHSFWEAQLPELFGKNYNLYTGEAHYINNIEQAVWDIIDTSYALVDAMLQPEYNMRKDNPEDKQYVMENGLPKRNPFGSKIHAYAYAHVYHELLNGMVEKQMRAALMHTADFWYTAWVNAGKPDLSDMDPDYTTEQNKATYKQDMSAWQKGKVRGCKSERDYPPVK